MNSEQFKNFLIPEIGNEFNSYSTNQKSQIAEDLTNDILQKIVASIEQVSMGNSSIKDDSSVLEIYLSNISLQIENDGLEKHIDSNGQISINIIKNAEKEFVKSAVFNEYLREKNNITESSGDLDSKKLFAFSETQMKYMNALAKMSKEDFLDAWNRSTKEQKDAFLGAMDSRDVDG